MRRLSLFVVVIVAALTLSVARGHAAEHYAASIVPVANEPNLNGNLVRVTLDGTHPTVLLEGVTDFFPQADGGILAIRRTSRSGHDLLYLAPGHVKDAIVLESAFAYGAVAMSADGRQWAALARPGVGRGWELHWGPVGRKAVVVPLPAPATRLYWDELPVVDADGWSELGANGWHKLDSFTPPDARRSMLNKSETLQVKQDGDEVQVSRVWFTGTVKSLARIPGTLRSFAVSPDLSVALVCLEDGKAYAVDLHTGKSRQTFAKGAGKLLR